MFRSLRLAAAVTATAIGCAVAPAVASAAVMVQIPAEAQLTADVLVIVPVTVTCGPYELPPTQSAITVTVQQSAKKGIAHGTGSFGGFASRLQLTCDGSPHTYDINVLANTNGVPFRKGDAVVSAFAHVLTGGCCTSDSGSAGPVTVRLR